MPGRVVISFNKYLVTKSVSYICIILSFLIEAQQQNNEQTSIKIK